MTEIEIWNGAHPRPAIGYLHDPDGRLIPIWSTQPGDLLSAMLEAIGDIPPMPSTGPGGELQVSGYTDVAGAQLPSYTYNPGNDVINQSVTAMYSSQVSAWNARAAVVAQAVTAMLPKQG